MPRRRRTTTAASALIASAALVLSACGGEANGGPSSTSPSETSSSSSSTSSSSSSSETSILPTDEPTPDPYAINCNLIPQKVVDTWTADGEPATVEATEDGCRVVSSSPEGALMVQWRYLDVSESSDDQGLVRDVSEASEPVEIADGLTAVRSNSDVDPTRKTRLYVTFDNGRTLYAEATATLDRPRTMPELQRMTSTVVKTYADQPPLPTPPVDPETSSTSSTSG